MTLYDFEAARSGPFSVEGVVNKNKIQPKVVIFGGHFACRR